MPADELLHINNQDNKFRMQVPRIEKNDIKPKGLKRFSFVHKQRARQASYETISWFIQVKVLAFPIFRKEYKILFSEQCT